MYRNFSLTEKEKKQILEQHGRYGYKKSKEQLSRKKNMVSEGLNNKPQYKRIYFNNGGDISIQASSFHYCEPRDDQGPYTEMELGYPSRGTKITNSLLKYAEDRHSGEDFDPYKTVYPYVPVSVIKELIDENGGIKRGELPPMSDEEEDGGDSMMSQNQFNEEEFSDGGKFRISNAGVTVNKIMVNVELTEDYENDSVNFTLKSDRDGNLTIVDFDNPSYGEIDDEEVREYMESMIASGKINVPDFISFDPETGKVDRYN
jgi:hypothetical protein